LSVLQVVGVAEAAGLFESVDLREQTPEHLKKQSVTRRSLASDKGALSFLWKYQEKPKASQRLAPKLTVIGKETRPFENPFLASSHRGFGQPDDQLQIFRLKQDSDGFSYGAEYRYVGKDLDNLEYYKRKTDSASELKNDQESAEVWAARQMGPLRLKTSFSRSWNNLDSDPRRYEMITHQGRMGLEFKTPSAPLYFFFSYSQASSGSNSEPEGSKPRGSSTRSFDGSLYYYGGDHFDVTLSSSYSPVQDRLHPDHKTQGFWHEITASIRPTSHIIITPTFSFGEYRYWYGESTEMPYASLSITYSGLFDKVDLSLWGDYSRTKDTEGYQDSETLNRWIGITWNPENSLVPGTRISFDLGQEEYVDKVYQGSSYDGYTASFSLNFPL
jgi:hypothetical protein